MLSAIHHSFGKPSQVLSAEQTPMPEPGPGEVRVRMTLATIHNHDVATVAGKYGYKPPLPAIGGSEATGTIDALGAGVQGLALGQRIAVSGVKGAWAEYFIARAESVVPLPDAISDEQAAQLIAMPMSALVLFEFLDVKQGDWLIQNAATGAVAKVLAMIAAARGIHVINIVRRNEAIAELEAAGIGNAVSSNAPDWPDKVRAIAGDAPIRAAIDGVGGPIANQMMALLGEHGTLVSFGAMSGQPLEISATDLIFKRAVVKGFWLGKMLETTPRETVARWIGELLRLVGDGTIKLDVGGIYPLAEIADAVKASGTPGRTGKILLKP
jgi:NADPH:quinone reductase-like Zn-dependent oxidoreductase